MAVCSNHRTVPGRDAHQATWTYGRGVVFCSLGAHAGKARAMALASGFWYASAADRDQILAEFEDDEAAALARGRAIVAARLARRRSLMAENTAA